MHISANFARIAVEVSRRFNRVSMRAHAGCLPPYHLPSDVVLIRLNTLPS